MALPDTLPATFGWFFTSNGSYVGPFAYNGNYYFFGKGTSSQYVVRVYKNSNPGTSSWTYIASDSVSPTFALQSMCARQIGSDVHIISSNTEASTSVNYFYQIFSMSSDTFTTTYETLFSITSNLPASGAFGATVERRSDGTTVAFIQDETAAWHGGDYSRVSYLKRSSGGTWDTSTTAVDSGTGGVNYTMPRSVLGTSDKIHFSYYDGTNIQHKSLSSADSLSSAEALNDTAVTHGQSSLAHINDGSNELVLATWLKSSDNKLYSSLITNDGTPAAETLWSDDTTYENLYRWQLFGDDANNKFYGMYSRGTDADIYFDVYDSGWAGTDVEAWDAVTMTQLFGMNVYQNDAGDTVLAYLVYANNYYYNEYVLVAGATPTSNPPRLRPLRIIRR